MAGRKYNPERDAVRKSCLVPVSVCPNEKKQIEEEAKKLGLSMSAYIRMLWLQHRKEC